MVNYDARHDDGTSLLWGFSDGSLSNEVNHIFSIAFYDGSLLKKVNHMDR